MVHSWYPIVSPTFPSLLIKRPPNKGPSGSRRDVVTCWDFSEHRALVCFALRCTLVACEHMVSKSESIMMNGFSQESSVALGTNALLCLIRFLSLAKAPGDKWAQDSAAK
mmetsp:Transcript_12213/g.19469  ORF Transcript_12213/g.19469 Transcript_12213/m.19469 type:complete len:110 (+) Transcript_12213:180-509(+)